MEISGYNLEDLEIENIGNWPFILRGAVIVLACFATLFLGYWLNLSEKMTQLNTLTQKMEVDLANFTSAQKRIASLDSYKREVKVMEGELEDLVKQLPTSSAEANLLDEVSGQAAANGLQIVAIKPGNQQDKSFYIENPIEFTLSGGYQGMGGFVSNVSNMTRMITFHNFEIKNIDKAVAADSKGPLMFVVNAKTYWVIEKEIHKK
jgi:type IV pilus assembly protein PilO